MGQLVHLSWKEMDRISVLGQCLDKHITQEEASKKLRLSTRQIKRLVAVFRREGPKGLLSKKRGKPSNNKLSEALRRADALKKLPI